jgi:hypothetical protein
LGRIAVGSYLLERLSRMSNPSIGLGAWGWRIHQKQLEMMCRVVRFAAAKKKKRETVMRA